MKKTLFVFFVVSILSTLNGWAQSAGEPAAPPAHNEGELAKQTQNPVASLISLPFQFNFNSGGGLQDQTFFNSELPAGDPIQAD